MAQASFDFQTLIPLLIPIILVQIGLQIYCLIDLNRQPAVTEPRWGWPISNWPKWGRAVVILLFQIPGVLVYLFAGRSNE